MTRHTPGPWHMREDADGFPMELRVDSHSHGAVAICYRGPRFESDDYDEFVSNAQLISAAPDLLAASRRLLLMLGALDARPATGALREAVAKACGETPGAPGR